MAYIEEKNPQAAVQFLDNFAQRCRNLAAFPNMGRKWNALTPPLRSFPIVVYIIPNSVKKNDRIPITPN